MQEVRNAITQRYSEQEFQKVLNTYIEKLWLVYGVDDKAINAKGEELHCEDEA